MTVFTILERVRRIFGLKTAPAVDAPFVHFGEWASEEDDRLFAHLAPNPSLARRPDKG